MDVGTFFTRLVSPATHKPSSSQGSGLRKVESVRDFAQAWEDVRTTLEEPDERQRVRGIKETAVPGILDELVNALVKETTEHVEPSRESDTGPLMEYMLNHAVLATLVELSAGDIPFGVKACVLQFTTKLIHSIPHHLLLQSWIFRPLCRLLRDSSLAETANEDLAPGMGREEPLVTGDIRAARERNGHVLEEGVLRLWAELWTRIEESPDLLLVVSPSPRIAVVPGTNATASLKGTAIGYLTRFLHDDGTNGIIARATISSILRTIFPRPATAPTNSTEAFQDARISLARYLTGPSAEFINVLVAGLGAIYSVLPNKVRLDTAAEVAGRMGGAGREGMQLGYLPGRSQAEAKPEESGVKRVFDADVQEQINMLLDLIGFINDILAATTYLGPSIELVRIARELRESIESTIRVSLVGNVLYPALLESSAEDGSATAIAVYLTSIAEDDAAAPTTVGQIIFRELLGFSSTWTSTPNDNLPYSLRDFMADLFAHGSRDSAVAASTLLSALTKRYCSTFAGTLFAAPTDHPTRFADDVHKVQAAQTATSTLSASRFEPLDQAGAFQHMAAEILPVALSLTPRSSVYNAPTIKPYLTILRQLLPRDSDIGSDLFDRQMQDGYDSDAFARMSCHPCLVGQLGQLDHRQERQHQHPSLRLDHDGPLLASIQARLKRFFTSDPFANLEVCRVICDISLCPMTSLEGWLLPKRKAGKPEQTVSRASDDPFVVGQGNVSAVAIIDILRGLLKDVETFRTAVPEFDQHFSERRDGLTGYKDDPDALSIKSRTTTESAPLTPTKSRGPRMMLTLASYLTPRKQVDASNKLAASAVDDLGTPTEMHYRQTTPILLDTPVQRVQQQDSPYSLSKRKIRVIHRPLISDGASTISSESSLAPASTIDSCSATVTLSDVLDNVVVLEALVREIIAVLLVRHSLSVDE